jgi:hypothetical protein
MLSQESGISDEIIRTRGYYTETVKTRLGHIGFLRKQQLTPSLVIPLYRPNGANSLYQIRPDKPRTQGVKKYQYEFPNDFHFQGCLDVTPLDWVFDALKNPSIPLLFTEGSEKADAAASHGLACVAAIGDWNGSGLNQYGGGL